MNVKHWRCRIGWHKWMKKGITLFGHGVSECALCHVKKEDFGYAICTTNPRTSRRAENGEGSKWQKKVADLKLKSYHIRARRKSWQYWPQVYDVVKRLDDVE